MSYIWGVANDPYDESTYRSGCWDYCCERCGIECDSTELCRECGILEQIEDDRERTLGAWDGGGEPAFTSCLECGGETEAQVYCEHCEGALMADMLRGEVALPAPAATPSDERITVRPGRMVA